MECAITTLLEYYDVKKHYESFECLIEDLDDKVFIIHGYYKYGVNGYQLKLKNMLIRYVYK